MNFYSATAARVTEIDIAEAAKTLGCRPPAVHAVMAVESNGGGFLPDKRPKILYEAHVFYRLTGGRFGINNVSAPKWDRSLYGAPGAHQYDRLAQALLLDQDAALKSASWGLFQVLGQNYRTCGFATVRDFVDAMVESERRHLDALAAFCLAGPCAEALRARDWFTFARHYNGPGQVEYYAGRLNAAYTAAAIKLQRELGVVVDGIWGPKSQAAYERRTACTT